jgi:hypothetical protein
MMATPSQLLARIIDLFGPVANANPANLMGKLMVAPSGRVLVGTTVDDGSNQFQVAGPVKITGGLATTTRPVYNGNLAWDAGNLTPGIYAILNTTPTFSGMITSSGYTCRNGVSGTTGNQFNSFWTGGVLQFWIDSTNVYSLTGSSDARIKHNVETSQGGLAKLLQLRNIQFEYQEQGIFKADGRRIEGFLTQEVSKVIPSAVHGEENAVFHVAEHSDVGPIKKELPQPQSLEPMPIVAVTVNAVQELHDIVQKQAAVIQSMQAEIAALKLSRTSY